MESADRHSGPAPQARLPGQARKEPAADVSLKPSEPPEEIPETAAELGVERPTTASRLYAFLLPLEAPLNQEKGKAEKRRARSLRRLWRQ